MLNRSIFIGKVFNNPTINKNDKLRIANFNLRITEKVKKRLKLTTINCVCFQGLADFTASSLKQDDLIIVEGRAQNNKRTINGKEFLDTNFIVDNIKFVEEK